MKLKKINLSGRGAVYEVESDADSQSTGNSDGSTPMLDRRRRGSDDGSYTSSGSTNLFKVRLNVKYNIVLYLIHIILLLYTVFILTNLFKVRLNVKYNYSRTLKILICFLIRIHVYIVPLYL